MRCADRRRARPAVALAAAVLALAGCAGDDAGDAPSPSSASLAATVVDPAKLLPGQAVPTPATEPVLTVTGRVGRTNTGGALALDAATIDAVGLKQVTLYEPWVKKTLTFQGVWLADLLAVAGVPDEAELLHVVALDDYAVDLKLADVRAGGVFLATRTGDGSPIPVKDGGPTRIVFAGDVPAGRNADQWIWSLKTLDVR